MPKRTDIKSILVIGSGPIIIGQACEFDYSGTQACRVLREDGYRVVLANSNPATIMTDPDFADATYIEPLTLEVLTKIIAKEKPDALLPTLGGQTALNLAMELDAAGVLAEHNVEMIGATAEAINTAEDRHEFKVAMLEIGMEVPRSGVAHTIEEAHAVVEEIGLPVIIRPAFILGGRGMGIASTPEEFAERAAFGLATSPISEVLIEESIAGWKEYELEVMRDHQDNQVIICSIENIDPMGTHTGDSITVAPIQTLTDVEYQDMRDAAFACLRRVGVETGGSNVQFAVEPETGRRVIIEMNPRVSRSSALASKATGFPIAKIAAKLAVGYTLPEIPNDITKVTPASFEPSIDYVVTKIPRWAFEKFPGTSGRLGTSMQSVGEVMAIGRTFPESLQKAFRSLEQGLIGFDAGEQFATLSDTELLEACGIATPDRLLHVEAAMRRGITAQAINEVSKIDPWYLDQMLQIVEERAALVDIASPQQDSPARSISELTKAEWKRAKQFGFSDPQIAEIFDCDELTARRARLDAGVVTTFKTVDTCAAEFEALTPYHYSTYEDESEVRPSDKKKIIILGSGPNRIGQGIEFDYCCVHASFALRDAGFETIMVNCNPETVSTDYDTSDRLYFEPLTYEDVMNIVEAENPIGIIVSLGGQTPLKLADRLPPELVLGTSPASIDAAEDRELWASLCARLEIPQPAGGTATDIEGAIEVVDRIGFPALVRPSYVLGGRAMEIVYGKDDLRRAMKALSAIGSLGKEGGLSAERPVLVDRFLEDATEVDVDAIRDAGGDCIIGGVMEHVEEAGVHSGDSACVLPPPNLLPQTVAVLESYTRKIAESLEVVGLINVQYAVKDGQVFVIEANPRASRTVPFVAKATGRPMAKIAARVMAGASLDNLRAEGKLPMEPVTGHWSVKEAVLPFNRFPETDALLGPEMRSTGEVMGIDVSPGLAFVKSQLAAGAIIKSSGTIFLSLSDRDKERGVEIATTFAKLGYDFVATEGTASVLRAAGLEVGAVLDKIDDSTSASPSDPVAAPDSEPARQTALDVIEAGEIAFVINTPRGQGARADGSYIRTAAAQSNVPLITTLSAAQAMALGLLEWQEHELEVRSLQSILGIEPRRS